MKRLFACAASAIVLAAAGGASAQELSFNIGATTDYVWRGVSQSSEDPAFSGGVDFSFGQFYAGTWASTVDFGDGTDGEWDFYLGVTPSAAGFDWDIGLIHYTYVGDPSGSDYNFTEFKVAVERTDGGVTWGGEVYFSPDFTGIADEATYVQGNLAYEISPNLSVSGAVGHQWVDTGDYLTWNAGVSYAFNDVFGVDLRYHDTGEHGWGDIYESRVVLSLTAGF